MANDPKAKPQQLTERELQPFLLWLFTETDYRNQVNAWREARTKAARAPADKPDNQE